MKNKKSFKVDKSYFKLNAKLIEVGELIHIKRENLPDIFKKVLVLKTKDGQRLFPEIRNKKLSMMDNLVIGDLVEIEYTFEGSEKDNKRYNNIYINTIKKV